MKVTPKKLKANRKNGKKSKGPITPEGKKKVSQNAVKHGLYAKPLILDSPKLKDDYHEYNRLIFSLNDEHDPQGMHEENYVREIANCIWRARRVIFAENAMISRQLNSIDEVIETRFAIVKQLLDSDSDYAISPEEMERYRQEEIGINCMPNKATADAILRFERHLDIKKTRALKSLLTLQKNRRAHPHKETSLEPYIPVEQTQTPTNPIPDNQLYESQTPAPVPESSHLGDSKNGGFCRRDSQNQASACRRDSQEQAPACRAEVSDFCHPDGEEQASGHLGDSKKGGFCHPDAEKTLIEKLFADNQIIEDDPPTTQSPVPQDPRGFGLRLKKQTQSKDKPMSNK